MCGFAGMLRLDGTALAPDSSAVLRRMAEVIAHRGPDDDQLEVDGPFGVAFRRLSIVDLPGGRQPMRNEDGSLVLVVNGEIYNHRELRASLRGSHVFQSRSDSEIVLHLYEERGLDFLDDLSGMYAIALWDRRQNRLLLARDRFGIKPLYYARDRSVLVFGSEIKALLQAPTCPRELDWDAALADPWVSGEAVTNPGVPASYFRGIEYLPAASYVLQDLEGGAPVARRYWQLPLAHAGDASASDPATYIEEYRELLGDSVRKCLMSDVEFGVLLSGGIDSAAVCAFAAPASPGFHTFTVLSRSTLGNGDAEHAHRLAGHLDLANHQVAFRWQEDAFALDHWRELLWLTETPLCGPEHLYKYHLFRFAKALRPGLKVMLTGQGSDEFNGGYSSLFAPPEEPSWDGFIAALEQLERGRLHASGAARLACWDARSGVPLLTREYLAARAATASPIDPWEAYVATKARDLQIFNLWHEDRTAAANHIENRVPFLDHRLVELTLGIPANLRPALLWDKQILRSALVSRLPERFCNRPKVPFFHGPDVRFTNRLLLGLLTRDGGALVEEAFAATSGLSTIVDRAAFDAALARVQDDAEAENVELLLRLVNMGLLDRMMREAARPAGVELPILPEHVIEGWDTGVAEIRAALEPPRHIDLDRPLGFAANAYLVRRDGAVALGESYVVVDEQVRYVIDAERAPAWLEVVRRLNGERSLNDVLSALGLELTDIREQLEVALDGGVVVYS